MAFVKAYWVKVQLGTFLVPHMYTVLVTDDTEDKIELSVLHSNCVQFMLKHMVGFKFFVRLCKNYSMTT